MRSSCYSSTHHLLFCLTHFNPCPWGSLSKWAKQALVCLSAACRPGDLPAKTDPVWLQSFFLQEGWNCICPYFTLTRSWAQWQLLRSCQAEKQNLLLLLVSFQAIWLFIKALFRLRNITETRRLAKFEEIRVARCSTLDSYWISNEGKEPPLIGRWLSNQLCD